MIDSELYILQDYCMREGNAVLRRKACSFGKGVAAKIALTESRFAAMASASAFYLKAGICINSRGLTTHLETLMASCMNV